MSKPVRFIFFLICAIQCFFAVAFFFQFPFAVNLWPFEGTTPLTFIFLASIFAAAAIATLWSIITENYGALAGVALDYMLILMPVAILSFQLSASTGNVSLKTYGVICLLGVLFGLGLLLWSIRVPMDTTLPMPRPVKIAFVIFILALLIVSTQLIFKIPNIIPWKITPDLSVVIGWMFMGAALYFIYGLLRPSWVNAAGQLAGFLAYDVVLIVPFLTRLPTTAPEFLPGLIVYVTIVILSGALAIYYLFIHKPTRVWR
jgi:hypothetical protein